MSKFCSDRVDRIPIRNDKFLMSRWMGDIAGEKSDVNLKVYIDKKMAHEFNCGRDRIDDTLVLHFNVGDDIRVAITGEWTKTRETLPRGCILYFLQLPMYR